MKQGMSLQSLASAIQTQAASKRDFVADTRKLIVEARPQDGGTYADLMLRMGDEKFPITAHAQSQIASDFGMPKKYLDLLSEPDLRGLLTENLNTLFRRRPKTRLLRTLFGSNRAFLSNSYRALDNDVVLDSVFPVLRDFEEIRIESSNLTETRMYLKVVFPRMQAEVVGDVVQYGVSISNS